MHSKIEIENKLHEIHSSLQLFLENHETRKNYLTYDIGLLSGLIGISNFYILYDTYFKANCSDEALNIILSKTLEKISGLNKSHSSGLSGLMFQIDFLCNMDVLDKESVDIDYNEINNALMEFCNRAFSKHDLDPLYGGLSPLPYFFESKNTKALNYVLELIFNSLKKTTLCNYHFLSKRFSDQEPQYETINAGLAHGLPGLIFYLSKINLLIPKNEKLELIVTDLINFMIKYKNKDRMSLFPQEFGNTVYLNSRLSWCYGDLTIANTIYFAGKSFNNKAWIDEGINIMMYNTKRLELKQNFVVDAGVCHGASGIAYLFQKFYYETGIKDFNDTAKYWLDKTFDFSIYEDGAAGFKAFKGEQQGYNNEYGMLEGISGIGLVMFSFLSDNELYRKWDRAILLS